MRPRHAALAVAVALSGLSAHAQTPAPAIRVTLLGTSGPSMSTERMESGQAPTTAFATNTHIRRDLVEKWPAQSIAIDAHDISEGVVYRNNGVTVTAFLVDHAPVSPAFGYRIDYGGHAVVISGDTRPADNLVKFAKGAASVILGYTRPR